MTKKIAIFDIDDTLVSTYNLALEKTRIVASKLGLRPPNDEEFRNVYGKLSFDECIGKMFPNTDIDVYKSVYDSLRAEMPYRPVGTPDEIFRILIKNNFLVGILTNGPENKTILKLEASNILADVRDSLFCLLHADNLKFRKPDPRCFEQLPNWHSIDKTKTYYFGDSVEDHDSATRAGINFVAVLSGYTKREVFQNLGMDNSDMLESISDVPSYFGLNDLSTTS